MNITATLTRSEPGVPAQGNRPATSAMVHYRLTRTIDGEDKPCGRLVLTGPDDGTALPAVEETFSVVLPEQA